eukprot:7381858-Prymnesium_polylepis.1
MKGVTATDRSGIGKKGTITWKKKEDSADLKYGSVRLRLNGMVRKSYSTRPVSTAPVRLDEDDIPDRERKPRPPAKPKAPKQRPLAAVPQPLAPSSGYLSLRVGDACYGLDRRGVWCPARVIQVKGTRVKLHYVNVGGLQTSDEWKQLSSRQVRLTAPQEDADDDDDDGDVD